MKPIGETIKQKPWLGWAIFLLTIVVVFFLGLLASSIIERRAEAVFAYTPQVQHEHWEPRNEVWGKNFPHQCESYMLTADTNFKSKYYGARKIDMLADYPELVILGQVIRFQRITGKVGGITGQLKTFGCRYYLLLL